MQPFANVLYHLVRRTCTLAYRSETLVAGMYIVGGFYNLCDYHHSLRLKLSVGSFGHHWVQRTPAMAAKLTDHQWTYAELFAFKVPPPPWCPPVQRRPSHKMLQLAQKGGELSPFNCGDTGLPSHIIKFNFFCRIQRTTEIRIF